MSEPADLVRDVGTDHHQDLVRRTGDDRFNEGRLEVSAEIFRPSFVDQGHEGAAKADGPLGWAEFVKPVRQALPDLKVTIQKKWSEGNYIATGNTATHEEELSGSSRVNRFC